MPKMARPKSRDQLRTRRHFRLRKKVVGSAERPRLVVYRSIKHIYAQLVDDTAQRTLMTVTDSGLSGKPTERSVEVGKRIAAKAKDAGVKRVVFDRAGYKYWSFNKWQRTRIQNQRRRHRLPSNRLRKDRAVREAAVPAGVEGGAVPVVDAARADKGGAADAVRAVARAEVARDVARGSHAIARVDGETVAVSSSRMSLRSIASPRS